MTQIEALTILLSRIIDQIYCNESSKIICIIVSGFLKKKKKKKLLLSRYQNRFLNFWGKMLKVVLYFTLTSRWFPDQISYPGGICVLFSLLSRRNRGSKNGKGVTVNAGNSHLEDLHLFVMCLRLL